MDLPEGWHEEREGKIFDQSGSLRVFSYSCTRRDLSVITCFTRYQVVYFNSECVVDRTMWKYFDPYDPIGGCDILHSEPPAEEGGNREASEKCKVWLDKEYLDWRNPLAYWV